jgi:serine/threonine-protein kinase RsbW
MKEDYRLVHQKDFPSVPSSIAEVETLIEQVCEELSVSEDVFGNMLISVTEACNNAIIHGNQGNESLKVNLKVLSNEERICFEVHDQGPGFDFENIPDPTEPNNLLKEHGRGVFLMRSLADDVFFNETGNCVSIFFDR